MKRWEILGLAAAFSVALAVAFILIPRKKPEIGGEMGPVFKLTKPDGTVEFTKPDGTVEFTKPDGTVTWKDKPFRKIELAWDITVAVDGKSGTVEFQHSSYVRWRQHEPPGRVTGRRSFHGDKSALGSTYRTPWTPLKKGFFEEKPPGTYVMFGDVIVDLKATTSDEKVYDPSAKSGLVKVKIVVTRANRLSVTIEPVGPRRIA